MQRDRAREKKQVEHIGRLLERSSLESINSRASTIDQFMRSIGIEYPRALFWSGSEIRRLEHDSSYYTRLTATIYHGPLVGISLYLPGSAQADPQLGLSRGCSTLLAFKSFYRPLARSGWQCFSPHQLGVIRSDTISCLFRRCSASCSVCTPTKGMPGHLAPAFHLSNSTPWPLATMCLESRQQPSIRLRYEGPDHPR